MTTPPTKRPCLLIDGLLLVNKPQGMTSNGLLQQVKRLYQAKKAGHTGSLDPLATGMLPICFGEATKFSDYLLNADKCYQVTGLLGAKTNTADSMGEVIAKAPHVDVSLDQLNTVLNEFLGTTQQVPSMFSALKHQGTPLYKLARAGITVERPARSITLHQLSLDDFDGHAFKLTVTCSKGTYIRNLVEDIGDKLGVGAHVTKLHRCYTAGFADDKMYSLEQLTSESCETLLSYLLPTDRMLVDFPQCYLDDASILALQQGKVLPHANALTGLVRIYDEAGLFAGLVMAEQGFLRVKRLISRES